MADHNGSTDVSTTPLVGVLDTNHHISHVPGLSSGLETSLEFPCGGVHHQHSHVRLIRSTYAALPFTNTSLKLFSNFYQCCGPGFGIRCFFNPWIRDPDPRWTSQIIFPRAQKPFFWVKILKFFDADPGSGMGKIRMRNGKMSDPV